MGIEERTDVRQIRHKEEMYEVDVQRAAAYVLQRRTHHSELREILLIGAEVHKHDGQQQELRQRQWNDGPGHSHVVPLQCIKCAEDDDDDKQREEPLRVHDTLRLLPIAMHDVSVKKEGEVEEYLAETGVHEEIAQFRLRAAIALRPREIFRLIAALVKHQGDEKQHDDGQPRSVLPYSPNKRRDSK